MQALTLFQGDTEEARNARLNDAIAQASREFWPRQVDLILDSEGRLVYDKMIKLRDEVDTVLRLRRLKQEHPPSIPIDQIAEREQAVKDLVNEVEDDCRKHLSKLDAGSAE